MGSPVRMVLDEGPARRGLVNTTLSPLWLVAAAVFTVSGAGAQPVPLMPAGAVPGSLDLTFDPTAGGEEVGFTTFHCAGQRAAKAVNDLVLQPDGRVLIGGQFVGVNGAARRHIARLLSDGQIDESFRPGWGTDGEVLAVGWCADGKVIVGGRFTSVDGQPRRSVARLHADGSVDAGFEVSGVQDFDGLGTVRTVAVQSDGSVIIGGTFTAIAGIEQYALARLNSDGSLDSSFNTLAGFGRSLRSVLEVVRQPDGKVLVGGTFGLVRLHPAGKPDATFQAGDTNLPLFTIEALALQPDGKILVGGTLGPATNGTCHGIARLLPDGPRDSTFNPATVKWGSVKAVLLQPDGKVVIAGNFQEVNGLAYRALARLHPDGRFDGSFDTRGFVHQRDLREVRALVWQSNGRILVGAAEMNPDSGCLFGCSSNGSWDWTFGANLQVSCAEVRSLVLQPDGKVVLGGAFAGVNNVPCPGVARFLPDGRLDQDFQAQVSRASSVAALALQPDGRLLVGGLEITGDPDGEPYGGLVRLNRDGGWDGTFAAPVGTMEGGPVISAIAVQPDGRILVGGDFTDLHGVARNGLARLQPDGSVDESFVGPANIVVGNGAGVNALLVQTDGRILVAGVAFPGPGNTRTYLMRLNSDGSVDASLAAPHWPGRINALAQLADGRILIGGSLTCTNTAAHFAVVRLRADGGVDEAFSAPAPSNHVAYALTIQADGRILVGGWPFGLVRLDPNGSPDASFHTGLKLTDSEDPLAVTVRAIVVQPDGQALAGGSFDNADGIPWEGLVRLNNDAPPAITEQPVHQARCVGQTANFRVFATGSPPLRYQWCLNGAAITDATNATLTLVSVQTNQAGLYSVVVSNPVGSVTSSNAALTVLRPFTLAAALDTTEGSCCLQLTGLEGRVPVRIEASTDLVRWETVYTHTVPAESCEFRDAIDRPVRFYRAVLPSIDR